MRVGGKAAVPAAAKRGFGIPAAAKLLCNLRTFRELLAPGYTKLLCNPRVSGELLVTGYTVVLSRYANKPP